MGRLVSIGARMHGTFLALAAMVLVVSLLALQSLEAADRRFSDYVDGVNLRAHLAAQLRTAVDVRAVSARNMVLSTDAQDLAAEAATVRQAHDEVQVTLRQLQAQARDAAAPEVERATIARIASVEDQYGPVALGIVDMALTGRRDAAVADIRTRCRPLLAQLVQATDSYASLARSAARTQAVQSRAAFRRDLLLLVTCCALVLLASAIAALRVTRSITQPILQAVQAAQAVARGDLRSGAPVVRQDETGHLLQALQAMSGSLRRIVGTVRDGTDSIATGSRQIAAGNADLSRRTEQQAASLQQTSAAMQQLTETVRTNARRTEEATSLVASACAVARRGGEVVDSVVVTMEEITRASRGISEITAIIDGLAFQTNLLALNAAVEAARAGDQGRGFAVVAEEVRSLARRSAEATRQIGRLIADSTASVQAGADQVSLAGQTMQDIVRQVTRVDALVAEIRLETRAQAEGIEQVGQAVHLLDAVTQQNAALVEQGSAAAHSLDAQAARLAETVRGFRLA